MFRTLVSIIGCDEHTTWISNRQSGILWLGHLTSNCSYQHAFNLVISFGRHDRRMRLTAMNCILWTHDYKLLSFECMTAKLVITSGCMTKTCWYSLDVWPQIVVILWREHDFMCVTSFGCIPAICFIFCTHDNKLLISFGRMTTTCCHPLDARFQVIVII
jgi:hypothetical protein